MKVRISSDAERDLADGFWFYEEQETGLGNYFRSSVSADIEALRLYGGVHPKVLGHHRSLCKTFPFSIYYRVDEKTIVTVVAVLGQRRDPAWIRKRLG